MKDLLIILKLSAILDFLIFSSSKTLNLLGCILFKIRCECKLTRAKFVDIVHTRRICLLF